MTVSLKSPENPESTIQAVRDKLRYAGTGKTVAPLIQWLAKHIRDAGKKNDVANISVYLAICCSPYDT